MERILKSGELAIILPVINCLDYTRGMIESIKTKHPYKLILINNGSDDYTYEYFEELAQVKDIIAIHFRENLGCSASWNYGIRKAIKKYDSKYFFIPNNDILLHPNTIDILIKTLGSPRSILTSATDVSGKVTHAQRVLKMKPPAKSRLTEAPEFSCFMMTKEAIDKIGYFDERFYPAYFEDNDYHYRIKQAGYKATKNSRALYFHYGSRTIKDNALIKTKANIGYAANAEYYDQKWGGAPSKEKYHTPFNK